MPLVEIPGFRQYSSSTNPRSVNQLDLTEVLNMVWASFGPEAREGSTLWKNDDQASWGNIAVVKTYKKRADAFYYVVVVLKTGRVFYIRSDAAGFGTVSATFTEINNPASGTPALAVAATQYDLFVFNNVLFLADSTNGYFSWNGTDADLVAPTKPTSSGTNNIVKFLDKSNRLMLLDDGGLTHLSITNNGSDTTSAGSGALNYGRVEGLIATNIIPYQDDVIITTEDTLTQKFQSYIITGIQFFDGAVTGSDRSQFEVRKINSIAGIVGNSAQEIAGDTIGLTPRGFVSLSKALSSTTEITNERDYLSFPIKELITQIDFTNADKISSVVDSKNGRYLCAVPFGTDVTNSNIILVYDFLRSSPGEGIYRWSIWTFAGVSDIGVLTNIAGDIYMTDTLGNIYQIDDADASNADYDATNTAQAINYVVKSAAVGGANPGTEKDFGNISFLLTKLTAAFDLEVNSVIDGVLIAQQVDGTPIRPIKIELPIAGLLYDTPGLLYDDFNYYDSAGADQRPVSLVDRGGRAQSMQWVFSTNTTGVSWGLGNFSVNIEVADETQKSGANFNDSI